jgi:Trp operon repressor
MRGLKKPNSLQHSLAKLTSEEEVRRLWAIVLSPSERKHLDKRWRAFQMLLDGQTQRSVSEALSISVATVSRAARALRQDRNFLEKLTGHGSQFRKDH